VAGTAFGDGRGGLNPPKASDRAASVAEEADATLELAVDPADAGRRLDAWLAESLGGRSRAAAQRLIEAGQVLVDGKVRSKSFKLAGGERVKADLRLPEQAVKPVGLEPEVVWEDDHLAIVDKPAGLVVHPAAGHRSATLVDLLARSAAGRRPLVVHRLDRNTSGLMLVAKDESTQRSLRELIRRREVEREYLVLVKGRLGAKRGVIEAPLGRDLRRRTRMSQRTAKPRSATTRFAVERYVNGFTLVRARLETGRTHQIRAHFAAIGKPVCGDPEYGGRKLLGLDRQFLHSSRIALPHPQTGRRLEETSPLPGDLAAALETASS
jgi:23S rRNA pseudouridine1911/1915/1917 synthase